MTYMLSGTETGTIVFDILRNDFHRPIVDGKCDRKNIEEHIVNGILSKQLPPMSVSDVDCVCDLIDDLIKEHGDGRDQMAKGT